MEKIKVSVICLVYNHEKYLRKCLDGFVNQECDFAYEVLIHDDASTDSSASIIREYEEKYPNIIKPIYQTENQYSKGVKISKNYIYPKAQGEYLAWCEGDDFWTDTKKLQKQVNFLDNNPEYSACAHRSILYNLKYDSKIIVPSISEDRDFTLDEIIKEDGELFSTNSFMTRKELYIKRPSCFDAKGFGDFQLYMYSAIAGKVHCLYDTMSQYNYMTSGSWSERHQNPQNRIAYYKEKARMLNEVNCFYNGKYNDFLEDKILMLEAYACLIQLENPKYRPFIKRYKKNKLKNKLKRMFPILKKVKDKITK